MLCRLKALSSLGEEFYPTSTKPEDVRYRNIGYGIELSVHVEVGVAEEVKEEVEEFFCPHTISKISEHFSHFHIS